MGVTALDRGLAAAVIDPGVVDAGRGNDSKIQAGPITRLTGRRAVRGRVERPARTVAVVVQRGKDHRTGRRPLGDQLRAGLSLDPRTFQFDDHPGINRQTSMQSGGDFPRSAIFHRSARIASNQKIRRNGIHHTAVAEPGRHFELRRRRPDAILNANLDAVAAVFAQHIAPSQRADAAVVRRVRV